MSGPLVPRIKLTSSGDEAMRLAVMVARRLTIAGDRRTNVVVPNAVYLPGGGVPEALVVAM